MGKSAPSSPDPVKTANAQWGANRKALWETAKVNSVDQFSPWGSTTYKRDAHGVPISQSVKLAPAQQKYFNQSNATRSSLAGLARGAALTPFSAPDDSAKIADTLYQRKLGMVQPQLDQAQKEMNLQLEERGLPIGSEVYRDEQNRLAKTRGDTLASISQDAILGAGQEQDRQLQEALTKYALPFNTLSAFNSGSPINLPQFQSQPGYQVNAPDIGNYIQNSYQNQLNAYNQNQQSLAGGLFGLGSAAISAFSDRRLKKDVKPIGKLNNGVSLFSYRYKWEGDDGPKHAGVMADEVRDVVPWAVERDPSGFDKVRYDEVVEAAA